MDIKEFVRKIKIKKEEKKFCLGTSGGDTVSRSKFIRKIGK